MGETENTQTDTAPALAAPTAQQDQLNERRARDLARLLKVKEETFSDNPQSAYEIMSYAATIPLLREKTKRQQLVLEVLRNAAAAFPKQPSQFQSDFNGQMGILVIQMQEYPHWFGIISSSNSDLINEYKNLKWIVWGLSIIGYGGIAVGADAAVRGAVREVDKLPRPTTTRDTIRGAGRGAIDGVKNLATGGFKGRAFVLAWVVGQTSATLAKARKAEVEFELNRRYKEGTLNYEEYQEAFGVNVDPPTRYVYPL